MDLIGTATAKDNLALFGGIRRGVEHINELPAGFFIKGTGRYGQVFGLISKCDSELQALATAQPIRGAVDKSKVGCEFAIFDGWLNLID